MRWIHFFFVEDPRNASCPREAIRPRKAICPRPSDIPRSLNFSYRTITFFTSAESPLEQRMTYNPEAR